VYNTNTSTSILAALATATYGPFPIGGTSALSSSGVGNYAYFAINTATGTAGLNGIPINQGDYLITTAGADATAVYVPVFEYQVLPTANVTA
jgi:hypothetical protein